MLKGTCCFTIHENVLAIEAEPGKDYFVNPVDGSIVADAAFVYEEITGDFICRANIALEHKALFDGGALFAFQDETHWVKACFERGDDGFKSVCTVMTNGLSDDCFAISVPGNDIWLQLARTKDVFSIHYSLDGENYYMTRLASMPFEKTMKVGFEAQSPTGDGGTRYFTDFAILHHGLSNPRMGK